MEELLGQMLSNHSGRSLGRRLVIRDRQFSGNTHNAISQLNEYGCWCYFYDDVGRGKGTPVDEVDSMCKVLANCYECAIRDTENEGESCVPWDVSFAPGINGAGMGLFDGCKANNPDSNCAQRACACEGFFVENLFALLLTGNAFAAMDEFSHKAGFDAGTDQGCPVKSGVKGASGTKDCCGQYPSRYPYKTLDGERACCNSRTYNTNVLNCCRNGHSQ